MVEDDTEIQQSIFVIINTSPGERVMRPNFGCRIHELLFWPANHHTAAIAERYITEAIERWEPRIRLQNVTVNPVSYDGAEVYGALEVLIEYTTRDTHGVRSMVYPYYLIPS